MISLVNQNLEAGNQIPSALTKKNTLKNSEELFNGLSPSIRLSVCKKNQLRTLHVAVITTCFKYHL
jgi:hypothetical protein